MTSTEEWSKPGPPSGGATAGDSRTDAEASGDVATEATGLLSTGAHSPGNHTGTPEEGWAGYADFEGLPWWKRPSVCRMVKHNSMLQAPES